MALGLLGWCGSFSKSRLLSTGDDKLTPEQARIHTKKSDGIAALGMRGKSINRQNSNVHQAISTGTPVQNLGHVRDWTFPSISDSGFLVF